MPITIQNIVALYTYYEIQYCQYPNWISLKLLLITKRYVNSKKKDNV